MTFHSLPRRASAVRYFDFLGCSVAFHALTRFARSLNSKG
jgi:hypothetical protein